jgi:rare lipoprotein A
VVSSAGNVWRVSFRSEPPLTSGSRLAFVSLVLVLWTAVLPATGAWGQVDDLAAVRKRLADANTQVAGVLNEIKSIDAKIFGTGRSINTNEREVAKLKTKISDIEKGIEELQGQIATAQRSSNARARRIYADGPASVFAALFTSKSLGDLPKLAMYWKSLSDQDAKVILESNRLKEKLAAQRNDLAAAADNLGSEVKRLSAKRVDLTKVREARAATLPRLKQAIDEAIAAEKAVLAARAAAVKKMPLQACGPPGAKQLDADKRLASLLDWYAPASGGESFIPPKLTSTGVVTSGPASWYGPGFDGCRASSGSTFRAAQMTAASLAFPFGTLLKVTFGGKAAVVVITDRGPYAAGRVLDLSQAASQAIGMSGVGEIRMEIMLPGEPAPPFP